MKLTNSVMCAYITILNKSGLINCVDDALSYAVYKNIRNLQKALQSYEKKQAEIIRKYGKKTTDGYILNKSDTKAYAAYIKEMGLISLMETDVDVYQLEPGFKIPECRTIAPIQYIMIIEFLTKKTNDK